MCPLYLIPLYEAIKHTDDTPKAQNRCGVYHDIS